MYRIISQRSSFLERAITYEVDGKLDVISAPSANASFDDLRRTLDEKFGKVLVPEKDDDTEKEVATVETQSATTEKPSRKKKTTSIVEKSS